MNDRSGGQAVPPSVRPDLLPLPRCARTPAFFGVARAVQPAPPMRRSFLSSLLFAAGALGATVTVAGCSSSDDAGAAAASSGAGRVSPAAASGSRLRARYVVAGDARQLVGFHDTERNEDCTFQRAEGRRMRCLPKAVLYGSAGGFSDAACQVPVGGTQEPCTTGAKYAYTITSDGSCGQRATELRTILDPSSPRYTLGPNGCTPLPASGPAPPSIVIPGEVIPWTAFVLAEETTVPAGEGLSERVLVAADGARQHLGYHDDALDADCAFELTASGVTRCVPSGASGSVYYADGACEKPSVVTDYTGSSPCTTDTRLFVDRTTSPSSCAPVRGVYELRERTSSANASDGSTYYAFGPGDPQACGESSLESGYGSTYRVREISSDLTASLPSTPRIGSGSGRLVPALVAQTSAAPTTLPTNGSRSASGSPGGGALEPGWHDTERDVDCSFALASDGKLRCLPTGGNATLFTTDDACKATTRVAVVERWCSGAAPGFVRELSKTCPTTTRVYAIGATPRDLPSGSTETIPGRCVRFGGVNKAYDATEIDPAQFAEGTPLTE